MSVIANIAAYRFVELADPPRWRERIGARAQRHALKGTVLLAAEGINLNLAGSPAELRAFVAWLVGHDEFAGLAVKESVSDALPFGRLLVKVKAEIIRMNEPAIRPHAQRAPVVDATKLARWLDTGVDDAGRGVVTLDTRNAFEVDHGRFGGALDWRLAKFSDFPQALRAHRAELDGKTVVTYCTGGIRCEKAALWMARSGVVDVLQLDGGILRYFEVAGGKHFQGECFVFDKRGLLKDTLDPVAPT